MAKKSDMQAVVKSETPTLRGILLWCGASNPDDEFLQKGLARMLERYAKPTGSGAAVSASPNVTIEARLKEFVAKYARLNGVREQLATPKYDHYVEGASDFADELERQFFAAPAPASPGPRPVCPKHKSILKHVEKDGNGYWKCTSCVIFISDEAINFYLQFFPASLNGEKRAEEQQRPKIICLCGSTRFIEQFAIQTWELELQGHIVLGCTLLPSWYCPVRDHFAESLGVKDQRDNHHLQKIDLADEVLVLNIGGYIGESTRREIEYATKTGKSINYLEPVAATTQGTPEGPMRITPPNYDDVALEGFAKLDELASGDSDEPRPCQSCGAEIGASHTFDCPEAQE